MNRPLIVRALVALLLIGMSLFVVPASRASALAGAASIDVGMGHVCAVDTGGSAYCWGANNLGQLGDGTTTARLTPTLVTGGLTFRSIAVGQFHTCGITTGGPTYCWGYGGGQLGNGDGVGSSSPRLVSGGLSFASIAAGRYFTCGVTTGGAAYCWGENSNGEIGDGTNTARLVPTAVSGGLTFTTISVKSGANHACGLTAAGAVYCWGYNTSAQIGDGTTTNRNAPTAVSGGLIFRSISAGLSHSCGVTTADVGYCWGSNGAGQIGDGSFGTRSAPTAVSGGLAFNTLASGSYNTCGINTAGAAWCWGGNSKGQSGNGTTTASTTPVAVSGGFKWLALSISEFNACGVTNGGGVMCWGEGTYGKLGNNQTADSSSPTPAWLFASTNNSTVAVVVDPSLTFVVSGFSGICNGASTTPSATSSGTAVGLGRINSANGIGAQGVIVSTNGAGFAVYLRQTAPIGLADVSGTNASPAAFPTLGTEAFGYTTSDDTLASGLTNRFINGGTKWAALTSTDADVSSGVGPVTSNGQCVAFQAGVAPTTRAGSYSTTVLYTAVPTF